MFLLYALMGMVGFGLSDYFVAPLSKAVGQYKGMLWNDVFMLIYLLVLLTISGNFHSLILPISDYLLVLVAGALCALGGLSYFQGSRVGKLAILSPLASSYPLIMMLLAVFFLHERLSLAQLGAISLVIGGTFFVSTNLKEMKNTRRLYSDKAVPYGLLASLFWGTSFVLNGDLTNRIGWLPTNTLMTIAALLVLVPLTLIKEKSLRISKTSQYSLAALIGIFTTMGYLGYSLGVSTSLISVVGPIISAAPLITIFMASVLLKEKLYKEQYFGIGMILFGIVLLSYLG